MINNIENLKGWRIEKIPNLLFFQEGPGVRNAQYTQKGVKLLNVANLQDGKVILENTERYISEDEAYGKYKHFLVDEGDLIIASSGIKIEYFEKKMGFAKKEHLPLCMNTSTIRFKTLDKAVLSLRYFCYFLKTNYFNKQIARLITGSAQLNFGPSHLSQINVIVPPLDIQNSIIEVLDKSQQLVDIRKEQIKSLDKLVKSKFIEMFGDPITNSKGWNTCELRDGIREIKYGTSTPPIFSEEGIPFVRATNIKVGRIIENDMKYISEQEAVKIEKCKLSLGDIIIVRSGANTGDNAFVTDEYVGAYGGYDIIFRLNERINYIFLNSLLNSVYRDIIINPLTRRAGQPHLNSEQIQSLVVYIPPIELQNQFADFVKQVDKLKFEMENSLKELEDNFNSLMQKAFKGELFK